MTEPPAVPRQLLVNGEALRIDVEAARGGGGDKYEPQSPEEAREFLLPQLDRAIEVAASLPPQFRAQQLYVEARLLPNYIAASDYPDPLLAQIGAVSVGSRADTGTYRTRSRERQAATRRLILAIDDAGLANLRTLIATGGRTRSASQAFTEIRKLDEIAIADIQQVITARPDADADLVTWEAVLHPATARGGELVAVGDGVLDQWSSLVQQLGGVIYDDFVRRSGGLTFSPLSLPRGTADAIARFNPLRVLRPMPAIRPRPSVTLRTGSRLSPPATRAPVQLEPLAAVFDGGLREPSAILFPRQSLSATSAAPQPDFLDHGTGVTAAAMHGLIWPGDVLPQPPLPLDTIRIMPPPPLPPDLESYWILDQILDLVAANDYKIVNLSLGPDQAVEDHSEPNRWTSELDRLAWDNDVLFIIAAGNCGEDDEATGLNRVQVPADMANGLAVGACDVPQPSPRWTRASYSSVGPGRQGNRVAPVGLQFGGVDDNLYPLMASDGTFLEASGTSFSTPLHSHALMGLCTRLPRANPSILRAFSVHFSERHRKHVALQHEHGYGRLPLDFGPHFDCGPDTTHVLYVDEIERGQLLGYQVPVPAGFGSVSVRITLAYASPVEPSQPTEYTRASLDLTLRPHRHQFRFRPQAGSPGTPVVIDERTDEALELLRAGWITSQEPVSKTLGSPARGAELALRDAGKWETLRHHRLTLNDGEVESPRLEVSYVARRTGSLDGSPTKVPFALIVSVIDPDLGGDLYDRTTSQFAALRPAARARSRVQLRGRGPSAATWG